MKSEVWFGWRADLLSRHDCVRLPSLLQSSTDECMDCWVGELNKRKKKWPMNQD